MLKIAIVTGAGSGIGRAVAVALAREGYAIVLAGRRRDLLEQTAIEAGGVANALVVPADVADPASVHHLFAKAKDTFGRLALLFNKPRSSEPGRPLKELTYT